MIMLLKMIMIINDNNNNDNDNDDNDVVIVIISMIIIEPSQELAIDCLVLQTRNASSGTICKWSDADCPWMESCPWNPRDGAPNLW